MSSRLSGGKNNNKKHILSVIQKFSKYSKFFFSPGYIHVFKLVLCMLGNFACFFVVCGFFLFKLTLSKNLSGIPLVSNSLAPDQVQHFVGPDPSPNCLQRLSKSLLVGKELNNCYIKCA